MRALVPLPFLLLTACASAEGDSKVTRTDRGTGGPIVVELFTSQGCSSCPPADRFLATLSKDPDVAPLSFHVDYWNDLGWADPYSQPAWTERQQEYARALGDRSVYTPELVVGGATGMVGSNTVQIRKAIETTPRPALLAATGTWSDNALEITATAPAEADAFVAVWEAERSIKVTRGENSGETLSNVRIVRRLVKLASAGSRGSARVAIDPAWKSVGAVAFAQRKDRKIVASAMIAR